jgi:hypothetical protein
MRRQLAALAGVVTVRRYGTDYQQGGMDPCGGQPQWCPPDLVSPATAAAIKAGPRVSSFNSGTAINGLAAGASTSALTIVASNGLARAFNLTDLVATVTGAGQTLDSLHFVVTVSGIVKLDFFGGRFARSNANGCVSACGLGFCLGPVEAATMVVTNESAVATGAADFFVLQGVSIYPGEQGYEEACGACVRPGGPWPGAAGDPQRPAGATTMEYEV